MPVDTQIPRTAAADAPNDWPIPANVELRLKAVTATLDGSAAAGSFLPAVELISDSGHLIARACDPNVSVAAGASAAATWFPGVKPTVTSSSTGAAPSVATFYRSTQIAGDPVQTIPAGSDANITWLHAALPSDGSITGPSIANQWVTFNIPCITIESFFVKWSAGTFPRAGVLGTQSRIIQADQYAFDNNGAVGVASDGVSTVWSSQHHPNAHIATDLLHAYVTNGDTGPQDVEEAWLVIYAWPAPGYGGLIPGYPV